MNILGDKKSRKSSTTSLNSSLMQLKVHLLTQYLRDLGYISEFVSDGNGDDIKLNCIRLIKSISSYNGDAFKESSNI